MVVGTRKPLNRVTQGVPHAAQTLLALVRAFLVRAEIVVICGHGSGLSLEYATREAIQSGQILTGGGGESRLTHGGMATLSLIMSMFQQQVSSAY